MTDEDLDEYIDVDSCLATSAPIVFNIESGQTSTASVVTEQESDDEVIEVRQTTVAETLSAIEVLENFMENDEKGFEFAQELDKMRVHALQKKTENLQQKTITSFNKSKIFETATFFRKQQRVEIKRIRILGTSCISNLKGVSRAS